MGWAIIHPRVNPINPAINAWSFRRMGRGLSIFGRIINHNKVEPINNVAWARAIMGPIVNKCGLIWNILEGGDCRGDHTTFVRNRILYAVVSLVAIINTKIRIKLVGLLMWDSIIKSLE